MTTQTSTTDQMARECLVMRMRLLSRAVSRLYDDALAPIGLTANQLNILVVIDRCQPISPGRIGRMLEMDKSTISRTLTRMIERRWLTERIGTDRRSVDLQVTATGGKKLLAAHRHWQLAQKQAMRLLGREAAGAIRDAGNAAGGLRADS